MTQTPQRPPSANTAANRGAPSAPPMPPPPPASSTLSTKRQSSETVAMPNGSRGSTNPAAHRPGAPPPMAKNIPSPKSSQPTFKQLIMEANEKGFSDIHLGVGEVPRFRNRGEIDAGDYPETDKETFMSWLRETLTEEEIKRFQETLDFDGATQFDFARVRINIFDSLKG
ncbi:MAG: type IV pili twitching motility protein PilT, partial [Cyanobacteria bacterium J06632_19]